MRTLRKSNWRRRGALGALVGLLGAGAARAGTETFDGLGLSNAWVAAGSFTGVESVVWTYANAAGSPTVHADDPAIVLQGGGAASNKGWLLSGPLTGGCGRVSATFKQVLSSTADCVVVVNGSTIANYRSSGVSGAVETVSYPAFDPETRLPFTNDFALMVSNRLAASGRVALDDLAWEPFRLFVRLDRTGTHAVFAGHEFNAAAEVYDVGQPTTGGWRVEPAFAGACSDTNSPALTLVPAEADVGQTFAVTYAAVDAEGGGHTNEAAFQLEVQAAPDPRILDFETISFGYDTNSGVTTNLNGMNWKFFNVRAGNTADDRKIGATSARFRHSSSALPGVLESQDMFAGIGTISLHYAYYGASNRTVTFALQVRADGDEDWTTVPGGTFDVDGHADLAASTFSADVNQIGQFYVRLITTGNAGEIANVDDVWIRPYGETLPRLVRNGSTNAPVGWETVVDFALSNAAGIVRTWERAVTPSNAHAAFEITADDQLRLRFAPVETNEWGTYVVDVAARIGDEVVGATSVALRVVSPPAFALAPVATNVVVTNPVDVGVADVVLHAGGTNWATAWFAAPPFVNPCSVSNKSRFRIGTGTMSADVGLHALTAVLTDLDTGVAATNAVALTVTDAGGGTNAAPGILFFATTNLTVSGQAGQVYLPFGLTNLAGGADESNWVWQGEPITNLDGADVNVAVPAAPDPRWFFYGVKVRAAP